MERVQRPVLTITPDRHRVRQYATDLWHHRDLVLVLASRDVKLRYRQTALGASWVLLQPLLGAGILSFVFGRVANLPSDGVPYFVFSFSGMLAWTLFSSTLTRASSSLVQHGAMLSKIFFPRLVLPLSTVFAALLDFLVALGLGFVLMGVNGIGVGLRLATAPLWIVALLLLAVGIGCVLASGAVRYRDVGQIIPVAVQLLLYASPVAYSAEVVPERYQTLFYLNPIASLVEAFRWSLLGTTAPEPGRVLYGCAVAVIAFGIGALVLSKSERRFADVI